jgi:PIN domain nuclease of toxin-antitoxin system
VRLLLDTHVFLWYLAADPALAGTTRDLIRDPGNQVFLSAVSLWEALVKYRLGKLPLPEQPEIYLPRQRIRHRIDSLDLDEGSVQRLASLPKHHRDPFDRMLICQAIEHRLVLVTVDDQLRIYPVATL